MVCVHVSCSRCRARTKSSQSQRSEDRIYVDLHEPGLAQSGKPRRAKRRQATLLGGKTERSLLASSASVAQAMDERVAHRPEQRRSRSGKLGALHGAQGRSDLGRGGIALTRKRARGVNRRDDGTSEADHEDSVMRMGRERPRTSLTDRRSARSVVNRFRHHETPRESAKRSR